MATSLLFWRNRTADRQGRAQPPKRTPLPRRGFRPRLEALENRDVPSTFLVLNSGDSGAGSLRQAIDDANMAAGTDTIVFAKAVSSIILTTGELQITDDLNIEGPGAKNRANASQFLKID